VRLTRLDDRMLRDIGLSQDDVHRLIGCRRPRQSNPWSQLGTYQ
jgi:uncharacterized protein YjiS (DUF1127 family)